MLVVAQICKYWVKTYVCCRLMVKYCLEDNKVFECMLKSMGA